MPFIIDIDPVAFSLVGIPVRWYGLVLVVAALVGGRTLHVLQNELGSLAQRLATS